jgi:hypothetical protein
MIGYTTNVEIHRRRGNRKDGAADERLNPDRPSSSGGGETD